MSYPVKFPGFADLPRDVQHDIWKRALTSLSGARINFLTMTRQPLDFAAENKAWKRVAPTPQTDDGLLEWITEYRRSLVSVDHSKAGAFGWGRFSTRNQVQEIAAVCTTAYEAAARVLRGRSTGPGNPNALCVLAPEPEPELSTRHSQPGIHLLADDAGFRKLGEIDTLAILWQPLKGQNRDLEQLHNAALPPFLETVYLLDIDRPLQLGARDFAELNVNAGPWFGHYFAFVDLEPNPVDHLTEHLRGERQDVRQFLMNDVTSLQTALFWQRAFEASVGGRPATVKVRILTPVMLTVN